MTPDLSLSQVKITSRHLERKAVIYIRQSSPKQVREHLDSQLTQRTLIRRAEDFLPFVNPNLSNFYPICTTGSRRLRVAS